jgi:hypothetical protein
LSLSNDGDQYHRNIQLAHFVRKAWHNQTEISIPDDNPLHIAVTMMNATILSKLIDKSELNIKTKDNKTPLDFSSKYDPPYNVAEIIAAGSHSGKSNFVAVLRYANRLSGELLIS